MTLYVPSQSPSLMPAVRRPRRKELTQQLRQTLIIMGVPIDNVTMDEALDRVESYVRIGRNTGKVHQVATVNTDFLVKSLEDENLRLLLQEADMCTADGMPLVWGSRMLNVPLRERVAGSDMVPRLAERAAARGLTMFFLGAGPGVAEKAKTQLEAAYPGLDVVGTASPFWKPGEAMDETVLDQIRDSQADILLVALGNPKQEHWIKEYGETVGIPVQIGIGASLDFIVGITKRAPMWMQNAGLEWLARLTQEPGRLWKRYATDLIRFVPSMLRQWWLMREKMDGPAVLNINTRSIGDTSIINLSGSLARGECRKLLKRGQRALSRRPNLTVNLADVKQLDCIAIGTLMELQKLARDSEGQLRIVGINRKLARIFRLLQMPTYFGIEDANLIKGVPANL